MNRLIDRHKMKKHRLLYRAAMASLLCASLIIVSVVYVDRPVALFMHATFHNRLIFIAMAAIANLPKPFALTYLFWVSVAAWSGRSITPKTRLLINVSIATIVAIMIKNELKFFFGRLWPESNPLPWVHNYPSFIRNKAFGFFPFHGGSSYDSFPSGHATAISAPMAVLWARVPRYRPLWAAIVLIVVSGLIIADFHFVSDTIAGVFLGATAAAGTVSLAQQCDRRFD